MIAIREAGPDLGLRPRAHQLDELPEQTVGLVLPAEDHAEHDRHRRSAGGRSDDLEAGRSPCPAHRVPIPARQRPAPDPALSKSEFFRRPLPAGVAARLLDTLVRDRPHRVERELAFTPMGGAYNRCPWTRRRSCTARSGFSSST
jgi:hypothetical protein